MTLLSYGVLKSSGGAIMRTKLAAVFLILLITALSLTGCTGFSKNETVAEGHFDFYVSDLGTRAFPAFFYAFSVFLFSVFVLYLFFICAFRNSQFFPDTFGNYSN